MWYQIRSYIHFLWRSKNHHSIHSPFLFSLWTQAVYGKKKYKTLSSYRKSLLEDKSTIRVNDFGAGSRVFISLERPVNKIAKLAGIPNKRQQLLARVSAHLKPTNSLELGTSLGLATAALALGNPKGQVYTVEGCTNTLKRAKKQLKSQNITNVTNYNSSFNAFLKENDLTFDLIYLDGAHSKTATLDLFNQLLPVITNNTLLLLDDIYWSPQMQEAFKEICKHPRVTVTIDSFYWGWVFFRQEQPEQHFVLRM